MLKRRMNKFNFDAMVTSLPTNGTDSFDSEEKLIVALDFGTTFSGIAYCFPNKQNSRVAPVQNWPGEFSVRICYQNVTG
jgi:hypothetical protein